MLDHLVLEFRRISAKRRLVGHASRDFEHIHAQLLGSFSGLFPDLPLAVNLVGRYVEILFVLPTRLPRHAFYFVVYGHNQIPFVCSFSVV